MRGGVKLCWPNRIVALKMLLLGFPGGWANLSRQHDLSPDDVDVRADLHLLP